MTGIRKVFDSDSDIWLSCGSAGAARGAARGRAGAAAAAQPAAGPADRGDSLARGVRLRHGRRPPVLAAQLRAPADGAPPNLIAPCISRWHASHDIVCCTVVMASVIWTTTSLWKPVTYITVPFTLHAQVHHLGSCGWGCVKRGITTRRCLDWPAHDQGLAVGL